MSEFKLNDRVLIKPFAKEGFIRGIFNSYENGTFKTEYEVWYQSEMWGWDHNQCNEHLLGKKAICIRVNGSDIESVGPSENHCEHEWRTYEGFTSKFDYCEKCDVKK